MSNTSPLPWPPTDAPTSPTELWRRLAAAYLAEHPDAAQALLDWADLATYRKHLTGGQRQRIRGAIDAIHPAN